MKYRKKPVVIDAIMWTGTKACADLICKEFPELETNCFTYTMNVDDRDPASWTFYTLEGLITASPYDYIIKGVKGEFYPCKPDIFEMTYERIEQ